MVGTATIVTVGFGGIIIIIIVITTLSKLLVLRLSRIAMLMCSCLMKEEEEVDLGLVK